MFRSRKGGALDPSQGRRIVAAAARRAGLRAGKGGVSPHWLRHAHATHALERQAPIHIVQATLGATRPAAARIGAALPVSRRLLDDPAVAPEDVARAVFHGLRRELSYGAYNTFRRDGRGAVLLDLKALRTGRVTPEYGVEEYQSRN